MTYVSAFCLHLERQIHSCVCRNAEAVVHEAGTDTLTLRCKLLINSILIANLLCYKLKCKILSFEIYMHKPIILGCMTL